MRDQLANGKVTRRALTNRFNSSIKTTVRTGKLTFEEGNSKKCPAGQIDAVKANKAAAFEEWIDNDGDWSRCSVTQSKTKRSARKRREEVALH